MPMTRRRPHFLETPKSPPIYLCRTQVVQEIKVLRAGVSAKEREKAERATLKEQERLVKAKVRLSILVLSFPPRPLIDPKEPQ